MNTIPENQKSDHLILLVGTNPLPNYVAAKLLLKERGQVYLVHSNKGERGTLKAAQRLETLLKNKNIVPYATMVEVDEADAVSIYSRVAEEVKKIKTGSVGLHYTGGTKVMAVQAHKAVRDVLTDKQPAVFSYLDARSYRMRFDPVGVDRPPAQKVLQDVTLSLRDLLLLHNVELKKDVLDEELILPKSARILAETIANPVAASMWRNWCYEILRGKDVHSGKNWKGDSQLKQITLLWPTEPELQPVVRQLCTEMGIKQETHLKLIEVKGKPFGKIEHFCRWLDGIWLEYYVFQQVQELKEKCRLSDIGMSLDTIQSAEKPDFEVDLGVMRGYQLFGISCTTSVDKHLMKSKLFEAYLRTSQLGGDEARTALICPHPQPKTLQKEIDANVPDKVRVFGAEHLLKLQEELALWFTEADNT